MLSVLIVWYRSPKHLIKMSEADNNKCEGFGPLNDHPAEGLKTNKLKQERRFLLPPLHPADSAGWPHTCPPQRSVWLWSEQQRLGLQADLSSNATSIIFHGRTQSPLSSLTDSVSFEIMWSFVETELRNCSDCLILHNMPHQNLVVVSVAMLFCLWFL